MIYLFSNTDNGECVRGVADVFVSSDATHCDVRYDAVRKAVESGRTFIAFGNPHMFVDVDDYLCSAGLYDSHDIDVFDTREDFFEAYKHNMPSAVLTDDLDFARHLKRLEATL